jgi:hypothetical protein
LGQKIIAVLMVGFLFVVGVAQLVNRTANTDPGALLAPFVVLVVASIILYATGVFAPHESIHDVGSHLLVRRGGKAFRVPPQEIGDADLVTVEGETRLKLFLVGNEALGESIEFIIGREEGAAIAQNLLDRARDARVPTP